MECMPEVTIGIPLRNSESFISYTLENIKLSDYPKDKIEVVIGNHGSTDNSINKIMKYRDYLNIKLINVPYNGPNRAFNRNQIIKNTTGDILIFIDADILVSKNFIKEHTRVHQEFDKALIAGYTYGKHPAIKKDIKHTINFKNINSSFDLLQSSYIYHDIRVINKNAVPVNGLDVLNHNTNPWILFWTCNVSIKTRDIKNIGNFDENYSGWGLEDDDLAYRCYLHGFKMVFSENAWVFHMPHDVDYRKNFLEKKINLNYFFKKWKNRELELFNYYDIPVDGQEKLNINLDFYPDSENYKSIIDNACFFLKYKVKNRLAFYINDEETGEKLNLTHCCIPYLDWKTSPYKKGNCVFYSYIGIKTHFDNASIDETVILLDIIMFIDEINLLLLLYECARISKTIVIIHGNQAKNDAYQSQCDKFYQLLERIKFKEIKIYR